MDTKIFIVEDNRFYGMLLKSEIEKSFQGDIEIFPTGEMFLNNLYRNPDIVILDHHLGTMNGVGLLKQVKEAHPQLEIILLSSQESMNVAVHSLKYGAYEYVEKNKYTFPRISFLIRKIQQESSTKKNKRIKSQFIIAGLIILLISVLMFFLKK
ncbi:MAG: DNA-binding NtrC family response regulator [Dokdonia sp.]|jgi:DNA-binding NtrC family response regulator